MGWEGKDYYLDVPIQVKVDRVSEYYVTVSRASSFVLRKLLPISTISSLFSVFPRNFSQSH